MSKDDIEALRERAGLIPASIKIVGPDAGDPLALSVIQDHAEDITAFLYKARQNVRLGGLDINKATYVSDDLDITYTNVQGEERISFLPRVDRPEPEAQPVYVPEQIDVETYPPEAIGPIHPQFLLCLMVLYQGNKIAAFDMVTLDNAEMGFVPIYQATMPQSSFSQPLKVGQYVFGGYEFIQTDVDFTGKNQAKGQFSMLSTTALLDAVTMSKQWLPLMNSAAGTQPPDPNVPVVVFTCDGSFQYLQGKLTKQTAAVPTQQPCAIDKTGLAYFGPEFDAPNMTLLMDSSDIDETIEENALAQFESLINTWVRAYSVDYIRWIEDYAYVDYRGTTTNLHYTNDDGSEGVTHVFGSNTTAYSQGKENVYVTSTCVPNFENTTGDHAYEYNITEIVGVTYYATAKLGQAMTVNQQNINMSHDNTYYYTYDFDANYYQYDTVNSSTPYFSSVFPRMAYADTSSMPDVVQDNVQANAINSYTVTTQVTQNFPEWGGNNWGGLTPLADETTYLDYDLGGGVASNFVSSEQLVVAGSTEAPDNPPTGANAGYDNLSYGQAYGLVEQVLAQLQNPAVVNGQVLPNTEPGPSGLFAGFTASTTRSSDQEFFPDGPLGVGVFEYYGPTTESQGQAVSRAPPGYKAQTIASVYTGSISWLGHTLYSTSQTSNTQSGSLTCYPFPPGSREEAFSVEMQQVNNDTPNYTIHTPYMTMGGLKVEPSFKPWMHLCNKDHMIQGFVANSKPYIYLDASMNITQQLADALNCAPTDIAACYMDIALSTIQTLGNVK